MADGPMDSSQQPPEKKLPELETPTHEVSQTDAPHGAPEDRTQLGLEREPSSLIQKPSKPDWREQLQALTQKLKQKEWARGFLSKLQHFEPMQAVEWAGRTFQRHGTGSVGATYGKAFTIGLCAWFLADLLALLLGKYVPEPPVARLSRSYSPSRRLKSLDDYNSIFSRNLFNSEGKIPGEEANTGPIDLGGAPVRTTLPFNLVGTLILRDELRSIATIEDKSASMVYPVRVEDEIPSKARILKIEARKVTFINTASGRREFVDLPEDIQVGGPRIQVSNAPRGGGGVGIEKVSPTQFNISRSEVDKTLQDLNKVLTEARAVPNFENGVPAGYKLFQIVPGSIYDKLGLQNGDVISNLNGQPINDPGKAFEMLSELKTSSHLELTIKKDGKSVTNSYDIR